LTTALNILVSIFFLLPGFIIIKVRQSTSEYREMSAFEYTTASIGYSIAIFLLWILYQISLEAVKVFHYHFFDELKNVVFGKDYDLLFDGFLVKCFIPYLNVVFLFAIFIYNFHWISLNKRIKSLLGHNRFTDHLTPWEDFFIINRNNWLVVELQDKRSIMGKVGFSSHLPFKKEVVLKRIDSTPIVLYDSNNKIVNFGPDIDQTYINTEDITAIHSVVDETIDEREITVISYLLVIMTFGILLFTSTVFSTSLLLNLYSSIGVPYYSILLLVIPLAISFFWNMGSLRRFP
jgi:hypothetical protein